MTAPPPGPAPAADYRRTRRITVLGSPGSGKTTLAAQLARETGLPLHHLDDEYWAPDWQRPGPQEWEARQRSLVAGPDWIVEGNYLPTVHLRAARADLVIVVDTATPRCLYRVLRRAWRIRRGDHGALPARVRAQAAAGARVRATRDLRGLLLLVARFRTASWPLLLERARTNPDTALLIAVGPGRPGRRARRLRRELARGRVPAHVIALPEVAALLRRTDPGAPQPSPRRRARPQQNRSK